MSDTTALVPTEIRDVEFYGDELRGALVDIDGTRQVYVPVRLICRYLGLSWPSQLNRIRRDEVLNEALRFVSMMNTNPQGGDPEVVCLPLDLIPGFLFGVEASRIKDPIVKERILLYRRECFRVLWERWAPEMTGLTTLAPTPPASGAALAYELATAVQNIAREQIDLEQRMGRAAQWAKGIESRVSALEVHLAPDTRISDAQAGELALQVKTIANELELRGHVNGYQRVYAELYRRYSISSYKNLPQSRYDEALDWLRGWYTEITRASASDSNVT